MSSCSPRGLRLKRAVSSSLIPFASSLKHFSWNWILLSLIIFFPLSSASFRGHCSGSSASISPYAKHSPLTHQPLACLPSQHPWSSSFPPACQFYIQNLLSSISTFSPLRMFRTFQPFLSCLQTSHILLIYFDCPSLSLPVKIATKGTLPLPTQPPVFSSVRSCPNHTV